MYLIVNGCFSNLTRRWKMLKIWRTLPAMMTFWRFTDFLNKPLSETVILVSSVCFFNLQMKPTVFGLQGVSTHSEWFSLNVKILSSNFHYFIGYFKIIYLKVFNSFLYISYNDIYIFTKCIKSLTVPFPQSVVKTKPNSYN